MGTSRCSGSAPSSTSVGPLELHADQLGRLVAQVEPALDAHHGVVGQQVADVGHGPGEHPDLDGGLEVLEGEGGHQLAPLGVLADQAGDHPADPAQLALARSPGTRRACTSVCRRRAASAPSSGMVADVEAEHLLLERQPLRLVELGVGDRDPGVVEDRLVAAPPRSPKRLITPCSRSRRRARVRSTICSKTRHRPWRGWPSESKAPALISDSTVRLLSTTGSTRSQKS